MPRRRQSNPGARHGVYSPPIAVTVEQRAESEAMQIQLYSMTRREKPWLNNPPDRTGIVSRRLWLGPSNGEPVEILLEGHIPVGWLGW